MTYYETWREINGHIDTIATDAPGGMRLVDAEDYDRLREALELADEYITNGIDLGYIHLPDAPDPALETPMKIRSALKEAGDDL